MGIKKFQKEREKQKKETILKKIQKLVLKAHDKNDPYIYQEAIDLAQKEDVENKYVAEAYVGLAVSSRHKFLFPDLEGAGHYYEQARDVYARIGDEMHAERMESRLKELGRKGRRKKGSLTERLKMTAIVICLFVGLFFIFNYFFGNVIKQTSDVPFYLLGVALFFVKVFGAYYLIKRKTMIVK